jgi:hypothetical protein
VSLDRNLPFRVLSCWVLKLAIAETIREAAERAIERKTEQRFQNFAVAYQGPWW